MRDWAELAAIIDEASERPGYQGPSPASVERIAADIAATRQTLLHWLGATALAGRRGRLSGTKLKAIREMLGQQQAGGRQSGSLS